jgi:hypothetical protein
MARTFITFSKTGTKSLCNGTRFSQTIRKLLITSQKIVTLAYTKKVI